MTRAPFLFLLLSLLSTAVLAAEADLGVTVSAPASGQAGTTLQWTVTVTNNGPDAATAVRIEAAVEYALVDSNPTPCGGNLNIGVLEPGAKHVFGCIAVMPDYAVVVKAAARVSSDANDPNPVNNFGFAEIIPITAPDVTLNAYGPTSVDPELPFDISIYYASLAFVESPGVVAEFFLPESVSFVSGPSFCEARPGNRVVCAIGNLPARELPYPRYEGFQLRLLAPPFTTERLRWRAELRMSVPDPTPENNRAENFLNLYRLFAVTTAADSGPGSLRDAITTASTPGICEAQEQACRILFRIPVENAKWVTIRPATPLPHVEGRWLSIDATSQTAFAGDTNPDGPEIELSGSLLSEGHGLVLENICSGSLKGFAINGFPGHGVHVRQHRGECFGFLGGSSSRGISDNYIGTDPTGTTAIPNLRGVVNERGGVLVYISNNVISGNRHAGVFEDGRGPSKIDNNRIGVTARGNQPLGNGASGVYIGPVAYGTDANNNMIAFNAHAGISIARGAAHVALAGNSLHANHSVGVDRGLDGVTNDIPMPVIESAAYDAATDTTRISGTSQSLYSSGVDTTSVSVYANDAPDPSGYGEGQYYLGGVRLRASGPWSVTVKGDWRGKWLAATTTHVSYIGWLRAGPRDPQPNGLEHGFLSTTSEFSRVFEVQ